MRWKTVFSLLFILFPLFVFSQISEDRIVAVVGDDPILESELNFAVATLVQQGLISGDELGSEEGKRRVMEDVLERLVEESLVLVAAERESIQVSEDEVDSIWNERWERMKEKYPSAEEFEQELASFGFSVKTFREKMKRDIRNSLLKERFLQRKFTMVELSDEDVKSFYEEFKDSLPDIPASVELAAILIEASPDSETVRRAREKIEKVYEELVKGSSFEVCAKRYSEDDATAKKGGILGRFKRGDLAAPLDSVVFSLEVGKFSEPVRSRKGFEILKLLSKSNETVEVAHILVKTPITPERYQQLISLADSVRTLAQDTLCDFGELAREFSNDAATHNTSGYLGKFYVDDLLPPLKEYVKGATTGDILPIIETDEGFQIFKVVSFTPGRKLTLETDFDIVRNIARNHKVGKQIDSWLERFRKTVYIDIRI